MTTKSASLSFSSFVRSIWAFPAVLTLVLLLLTAFGINGSSIGKYHQLFYGPSRDTSLIANQPQGIRSDEWLVNTQMAIAQKNNHYNKINHNIGSGEDMSLVVDVPYKDWSTIFRPHNLAFFIMPFQNAFAFHWWFMGYVLILACYFFVLELLPNKKVLAALLALGLFFAPFVQWWFLYGTLASIGYSLAIGLVFMKIIKSSDLKKTLLWGLALAYLVTAFALIFYPPFQISCAIAMAVFAVGYLFEKAPALPASSLLKKAAIVVGSLALAGGLIGLFLINHEAVVRALQQTAYPGKRIQTSGGFEPVRLLTGYLNTELEFETRAAHFPFNQSESANFVLLLPFLFLPSAILLVANWRKHHQVDWPLLLSNLGAIGLLAWIFVPHLDIFGKILLLNLVPHSRELIGFGILNLVVLILFIRLYQQHKKWLPKQGWLIGYSLAVFVFEALYGWRVMQHYPGFIGPYRITLFSALVAVIMYLLLLKKFEWSAVVLLAFCIMMTFHVNPLYHGTAILEDTELSTTIKSITAHDKSRWATESFLLENFAAMNGARSLSGVYTYPQLTLWAQADPAAKDSYNRYAHVVFVFDRNPDIQVPTKIQLGAGADSFGVTTEPCSAFLKKAGVKYLLTTTPLSQKEHCVVPFKQVVYPKLIAYIYTLTN